MAGKGEGGDLYLPPAVNSARYRTSLKSFHSNNSKDEAQEEDPDLHYDEESKFQSNYTSNQLAYNSTPFRHSEEDVINSTVKPDILDTAPKSRLRHFIEVLDAIDKEWSNKLNKENRLSIELPLILFAHIFNRAFIFFPVGLFIVIGGIRYETWMSVNGYKIPPSEDVTFATRFLLGICFMFFFSLMLVLMVISTTILKKLIKRQRPPLPEMIYAKRMNNLRGRETGTYAMPSGDSAACALFCYILTHQMKVQAIYLILPLVCLGRVYYHCHWIGDTIVGSVVGTMWGVFGCYFLYAIVPLMQLIVGKEFFLTAIQAI